MGRKVAAKTIIANDKSNAAIMKADLKQMLTICNAVTKVARGYKDADIRKILGGNLLRAWTAIEDGAAK